MKHRNFRFRLDLRRMTLLLASALLMVQCDRSSESGQTGTRADLPSSAPAAFSVDRPVLNRRQASNLAALPLACIETEYPNKLGQTLSHAEEIGEPHQLHPAFYGCFDWHSAVHGHWSLVALLRQFPDLEEAGRIRTLLSDRLTPENIRAETAYFEREGEYAFERTYGWAWLLKLAQELHLWDDPLARELEENLRPLTDLILLRYADFLPRLLYPVRVGEHPNTAFGMCFAWDYAKTLQKDTLLTLFAERATTYFMSDQGCPIDWEPGGFDFLSPCLEEVDLMRRVLGKEEFLEWLSLFMPEILEPGFQLEVARISDRSDGKLVHLDGLNFSRAWVLYGLANLDPRFAQLEPLANAHIEAALPNLVGDGYEGGHWLGSFAIYALQEAGLHH